MIQGCNDCAKTCPPQHRGVDGIQFWSFDFMKARVENMHSSSTNLIT
jgi:hypothetical protein